MGKGIAQVFAVKTDLSITLYDNHASDVLSDIEKDMKLLSSKGVLPEEDVEKRMSRIAFTDSMDDSCFGTADMVVECVFEDMQIKQNLFCELEKICPPDCIFATNTSVMSPTEISEKLDCKQRFVGTHFWNPAHLIPLVEVVKSEHTSEETADTVMKLLLECGKKAVLCQKDVPGFIANRLQHALWREAFYMVQEGIADPKTVDDACKYGPGLRWPVVGPMENSDMVGIPLTLNIHNYLLSHLADNHEPSPLLEQMLEEGHTGFGSGQGWQSWNEEEIKKSVSGLREYLIDYNSEKQKGE